MTLYRVWFQSRQDGRLIAGFDYRSLKFGLKLTTNPDRAVSLITDLEDPQVVEMRLYQAVIRRPTKSLKSCLTQTHLMRTPPFIGISNCLCVRPKNKRYSNLVRHM